jgi:hypothetical protein
MRPSRFEFRIRGRLAPELLARLDGFDSEIQPAETVLRGRIDDQAALHGLLERIRAFGLELVAVRPLDERQEHTQASSQGWR